MKSIIKVPANIEKSKSYRYGSSGDAYSLEGEPFGSVEYTIDVAFDGDATVVKYWMGKGLTNRQQWESQVVMKGVPQQIAERYVYHKLDSRNPLPKISGLKDKRWHLKKKRRVVTNYDIKDLVEEYGDVKLGLDLSDLEMRPVLLYEGQKAGVVTDAFMLVRDQKVADEVLGGHVEKLRQRIASSNKRLNPKLSKQEALKLADKEIAGRRGGTFPNWKALIPKDLVVTWQVVGTSVLDNGTQAAWLSDGEKFIAVDIDKLAFIVKHVPKFDAIRSTAVRPPEKRYLTKGALSPDAHDGILVFEEDGGMKALLMPLYVGEIPSDIRQASKRIKRQPSPSELEAIHADRSERARAMDESRSNVVTIDSSDPRVKRWKKDPGSVDIEGIDTPRKKRKRTKVKKQKKTSPTVGVSGSKR